MGREVRWEGEVWWGGDEVGWRGRVRWGGVGGGGWGGK